MGVKRRCRILAARTGPERAVGARPREGSERGLQAVCHAVPSRPAAPLHPAPWGVPGEPVADPNPSPTPPRAPAPPRSPNGHGAHLHICIFQCVYLHTARDIRAGGRGAGGAGRSPGSPVHRCASARTSL